MRCSRRKAVESLGEAKTDIDIFRAIADGMGFDGLYKSDEEYLREYLDTPENLEAGCGYDVMSEQSIFGEPKIAARVGVEYNATGRTQFFLEKLISRDTIEWTTRPQDHYPWYEEAFEAYQANPAREKYPLYGVSGHHHYWAHSLLRAFRGSTNFAVNLRCSFTRKPLRRAAFSRATRCVCSTTTAMWR